MFCFFVKFETLRAQPRWFALYQLGAQKGWLTTQYTLLPHILPVDRFRGAVVVEGVMTRHNCLPTHARESHNVKSVQHNAFDAMVLLSG